jgi:hypothetical protein
MITKLTTVPDKFDLTALSTIEGCRPDATQIELELEKMPHLTTDQTYTSPSTTVTTRDATRCKIMVEAMGQLPGPTDSLHMVVSGRFSLFDAIPAALELSSPTTIADLHIATLGFSKSNIADLSLLLDTGKVERVTLLCSHYFAGTSPDIYNLATAELTKREQSFFSLRTHAKLLAMKFKNGQTLTIESSANLRSCKNIEQMSLFGDPGLYQFHTSWIESLKSEVRK